MKRWHLTAGLAATTAAATLIAPRLGFDLPLGEAKPEPVPTPAPTPPSSTGSVDLSLQLDRTALPSERRSERFVTLVLSTEATGELSRRPLHLGVVMDASGSMSARGKMEYARQAASLLVEGLEPRDTFSLVSFADEAVTVIPATNVEDPGAIQRSVHRVLEGGGTNLHAGLSMGAEQIGQSLSDTGIGRLVLLSDGNANVGLSDPQSLARLAGRISERGLSLSAVGLGVDYNEDTLLRLADLGGGTYDFVDDPASLERAFADELDRSSRVVARDLDVELALKPGVQLLEVLGWDSEATADGGHRIRIGEIYAGEPRKVVLRIAVEAGPAQEAMPLVIGQASYEDLALGQRASSKAMLAARTTDDAAILRQSVDRNAAIESMRAWGNTFLDRSTRAYARGSIVEARELAQQGQRILEVNAEELDEPALAEEARRLQEQRDVYRQHAPSSYEGKRSIKRGKEIYLESARSKK